MDITCPRCGSSAEVNYYGPCDACRDQLRAEVTAAGRHAQQLEYEPKMNVTPNAVAFKDE